MREKIKRRKDEGFTLIELMIVIAVIGILAVVLVPKMGSIKNSAKITGVQTNIRSMTMLIQAMNGLTPGSTLDTQVTSNLGTLQDAISMRNPFTSGEGVGSTNAYVVVSTAPTLPATPITPGTIYVSVDETATVPTITLIGCDESGDEIDDLTITIEP